ncbi:hypothetical protein M569_11414 [Genlisea aurea]|uniref:Uncharacterized protein n=1 Tax=Genlisea aurea TaxID=192259 RepID=S8DKM2_9LAMI|nr:hypothetical protein M569_11414 [Genlisea aurea]
MAFRSGAISKRAVNLLKFAAADSPTARPISYLQPLRPSSPLFSRPSLGVLESLLPLHSAVSSARLTSCLGIDAKGCRSLSQGMLSSANPGV